MKIAPRDYQRAGLDAIIRELKTRVSTVADMATGTGKTYFFAWLCMLLGGRILILVHRDELKRQAIEKILRVCPDLGVTVEQGQSRGDRRGEKNLFEEKPSSIVVASKDTLCRPGRLRRYQPNDFDFVMIDECFPAGTRVDGRDIETLAAGDSVTSFDVANGCYIQRKITHVFKSRPSRLVTVSFASGRKVTSTASHPFYSLTRSCYVVAKDLLLDDVVITQGGCDGWQRERSEPNAADDSCLCDVSPRVLSEELANSQSASLLQSTLLANGAFRSIANYDCKNQSSVRIGADETEQPDSPFRRSRENFSISSETKVGSGTARRKRSWSHGFGTSDCRCARLEARSCHSYGSETNQGFTPDTLQDRCCQCGFENRSRDRRFQSRPFISPFAGFQEGCFSQFDWVDGVEVHEPDGDGRFDELCSDGFVYNLEVEGEHNYFANGVLVHNCHRAVKKNESYASIVRHFCRPPIGTGIARLIGLSASLDRLDGEALGGMFQSVAYRYSLTEAIEDGYLLEPRVKRAYIKGLKLLALPRSRTPDGEREVSASALDRAMKSREYGLGIAAPLLEVAGDDKQAAVFCSSAPQAEIQAAVLNAEKRGSAALCLGEPYQSIEERREAQWRMRNKNIQFLVTCDAIVEGWDYDGCDIVVLKPSGSRSKVAQMSGRATRPLDGCVDVWDTAELRRMAIANSPKPYCTIIDPCGVSEEHSLVNVTDIYRGRYSAALSKEKAPSRPTRRPLDIEERRGMRNALAVIEEERLAGFRVQVDYELVDTEMMSEPVRKAGAVSKSLLSHPATERQCRWLELKGYPIPAGMTKRQASDAIGGIRAREDAGPATANQRAVLAKLGYGVDVTKGEAHAILDREFKQREERNEDT